MKIVALTTVLAGANAAKINQIDAVHWKATVRGTRKLGKCEGDCKTNDDCAGSLKCFQTVANDANFLPDCEGKTGGQQWDYCYDPATVRNTAESTVLATHGHHANKMGKIGVCQGHCKRTSDCADGLMCFTRINSDPNSLPGCVGKTHKSYNYCYNPAFVQNVAKAATIATHGERAHQMGTKIGLCHGDCDNDSQCAAGLKCLQRTDGDRAKLPGCKGQAHKDYDYCYDPAFVTSKATTLQTHGKEAAHLAWKAGGKLGLCQGHCKHDGQCAGTMKCFVSGKSGNTVSSCGGKTFKNHNYCHQPIRSNYMNCHDWNCAEWCKFYDDALVDEYVAQGCDDDGFDTCACN